MRISCSSSVLQMATDIAVAISPTCSQECLVSDLHLEQRYMTSVSDLTHFCFQAFQQILAPFDCACPNFGGRFLPQTVLYQLLSGHQRTPYPSKLHRTPRLAWSEARPGVTLLCKKGNILSLPLLQHIGICRNAQPWGQVSDPLCTPRAFHL